MRQLVVRRGGLTLLVAVGLALLMPGLADACAALFSPDASVRQSAQRIIFTVDEQAQQITAYVQVNYTGTAEDFAWIVPMPSNPEVDVIAPEIFRELETATEPRYLFPERPDCVQWPGFGLGAGAPEGAVGGAAPSSVQVYQQGSVGPYDFSVVGGDDAQELAGWLREHGYRVTPAMDPLIKLYTDERMLFLAMRLQGDKAAQDIQPVKMRFAAARPMIPLRLAAVGAQPDTRIMVWIFAARQAVPVNLKRLLIADDQVALTSFNGADNYQDVRRTALGAVDGQGLVVEYARPTRALEAADPLLRELTTAYPYLTRFYGTMSPEQMRADPVFELQNGLPELSNLHDLSGRVNPYVCSGRRVLSANEQLVAADSPRGLWIRYRWLVPWLAGAAVGMGLGAVARRRRKA